jgi:predicted nucleic acid-binding protein
MIVVDSSAVCELLLDRGLAGAVRARMRGHSLHAPEALGLEVQSVLRGLVLGKKIDLADAEAARVDFAAMLIATHRHEPVLDRIWELRHNYSPYDAAFVATAERLNARLLTADARMARAIGARCRFDLVT